MLGADGVVVGTRFVGIGRSPYSKPHTDKALTATGDSTIRTKVLTPARRNLAEDTRSVS